MAATATATRRRAVSQPRRRQVTPPAGFVPVALRTAGAVGGIADSGLVVRLTRGRLWIGMLAALLVGIVALNVIALSFNASSSAAGRQADVLKRQNSSLHAQIAELTASSEVQQTAGRLGLHLPNPNQIGYLKPSPGDAAAAAKRLRGGDLAAAEYVAPVEPVVTEPAVAPVTDTAVATTDPAATETAPTTETAVAPAPAAPAAATESTPAVSGGGVSSP